MKLSSERSEIVVIGGGLSGICASLIAARQGRLVCLIEKEPILGGKVGKDQRFPLDEFNSLPQVYQRDSGLINEIWHLLFQRNTEGTFIGQARVFQDWLLSEKRIKIFFDTELESVRFEKGRILSVVGYNRKLDFRAAFQGKYFLDCTGSGRIAELSGLDGEKGVDRNELNDTKSLHPEFDEVYGGCYITIERGEGTYPFACPSWVKLKWEDNHLVPRVNLMKSLENDLAGEHLIEWQGISTNKEMDSNELAFAAWDFLKNRSPICKLAENLRLCHITKNICPPLSFRCQGDRKLSLKDLTDGEKFDDSVAVGKSPVRQNFSQISSTQEKSRLMQPFELPLSSMLSKACKNLLCAGSSAFATELTSRSLGSSSCSSQMGTVIGLVAALSVEKNRLPRTLAKEGYVDELRRRLSRINHQCSLRYIEDADNLALSASVGASSTLSDWSEATGGIVQEVETNHCQFQFPVTSYHIETLQVWLTAADQQELSFKLLEGAGYQNSLPGLCIYSEIVKQKGGNNQLTLDLGLEINYQGWCFLEVGSDKPFRVPLVSDGPVGYVLHDKLLSRSKGHARKLQGFQPVTSRTSIPSAAPKVKVTPTPQVYGPQNVANPFFKPNSLPQLWISKATDFQYPEFIEFEWNNLQDISCIEVSFDPSYDFIYPNSPTSMEVANFQSLVRDYRIYATGDDSKSELIVEVTDNQLPFVSHTFDPFQAKGIELEIRSTHGLNRAQVYQLRVYS